MLLRPPNEVLSHNLLFCFPVLRLLLLSLTIFKAHLCLHNKSLTHHFESPTFSQTSSCIQLPCLPCFWTGVFLQSNYQSESANSFALWKSTVGLRLSIFKTSFLLAVSTVGSLGVVAVLGEPAYPFRGKTLRMSMEAARVTPQILQIPYGSVFVQGTLSFLCLKRHHQDAHHFLWVAPLALRDVSAFLLIPGQGGRRQDGGDAGSFSAAFFSEY